MVKYELINKYTRQQAEEKYSFIKIGPIKGEYIKGLLKSNFSLALNADYKTVIDGQDVLRTAQDAAAFAGKTVFTTGVLTLQTYRGGSYVNVAPDFLVVDWNGNGEVVRNADKLFSCCMPSGGQVLKFLTEDIETSIRKALATTNILGNAPPAVTVEISNFFKLSDMVIKSVKVEFSKEMGVGGPLYGEFSVTMEQKMITGETGIFLADNSTTRATEK